jgi:hypothetical protein
MAVAVVAAKEKSARRTTRKSDVRDMRVVCVTPDGHVVARERMEHTPRTGRYAREYATPDGYVGVETDVKKNRHGAYEGGATYRYQPSPLFGFTVRGGTGGRNQTENRRETCRICDRFGCKEYEPYILSKKQQREYCRR